MYIVAMTTIWFVLQITPMLALCYNYRSSFLVSSTFMYAYTMALILIHKRLIFNRKWEAGNLFPLYIFAFPNFCVFPIVESTGGCKICWLEDNLHQWNRISLIRCWLCSKKYQWCAHITKMDKCLIIYMEKDEPSHN